jgi:hypothetical protein
VRKQEALQLVKVSYLERDPNAYFGLRLGFIVSSVQGSFDGATIVLKGCDGLGTARTAEALVKKVPRL